MQIGGCRGSEPQTTHNDGKGCLKKAPTHQTRLLPDRTTSSCSSHCAMFLRDLLLLCWVSQSQDHGPSQQIGPVPTGSATHPGALGHLQKILRKWWV